MRKMIHLFVWLACTSAMASSEIKVAVTVDDLPRHSEAPMGTTQIQIARKMLDVLKKHKVPEVYGFTNAGKLKEDPNYHQILKEWAKAFPLGNHSFTHRNINKVSIEEFKKEISLNEAILKKYNHSQNWKVFRYPFLKEGETLERRNAIRNYLFDHGYQIAQVTVDFEDWSWNEPFTRCKSKNDASAIDQLRKSFMIASVGALVRADALARILYNKSINHILLLHMGVFDAEMLDELLTAYEKKGVKFVSLTEAMKDPIYSHDPKYVKEAGAEFIYQVARERGIKTQDLNLPPFLNYQDELQKTCLLRD